MNDRPRSQSCTDIMSLSIRKVSPEDAPQICAIYNHYIRETVITFEQQPLSVAEMQARIESYASSHAWLVAERDGQLLGYAYATRWRSRAAYDHTVESTVYVADAARGSGIGRPLYLALLEALRQQSIHAVVGCIALPNPASVALHEKCGFEKVAHFAQVGRKFDQWIDVGFWQILL
jgi:L-amino acid N-acyltransferase YncA